MLKSSIESSVQSRQEHVDRSIAALYRWYVAHSQPRRAWNPNCDFAWKEIRRDLPEDIMRIVQGFYAVEQFIPDYAVELVGLLRRDYGRSQFYLMWGSEEAKHADLWQNVLLATGYRSLESLEEYSRDLRNRMWQLPFDDPLEMLLYTVFQERATQVSYTRLRATVSNRQDSESWDPVLANACRAIATDEVAHYEFFLSASLLYLYYFPERFLDALTRVLAFFEMPAAVLIADYSTFIEALYRRQIFGKKTYFREVVTLVCEKLGVHPLKKLDAPMKRMRNSQASEPRLPSSPQDIFDFDTVQTSIVGIFLRLGSFEREAGIDDLFETGLLPHSWEER